MANVNLSEISGTLAFEPGDLEKVFRVLGAFRRMQQANPEVGLGNLSVEESVALSTWVSELQVDVYGDIGLALNITE